MKANYHTHTWRCNHASGTEEQYILHAIENGFQILGFSDHTPYLFPDGYRSRIRMLPDQLDGYVRCIQNLQKEYHDKIGLHIGLEAEYFPAYFSDLHSFLRNYPVEYLILGQHYLPNEPNGRYSGAPTADIAVLKQYCHQCMDALQTGLFTYFAHPDLMNFVGDDSVFHKHMGELIRETANCGLCIELNLLGLREGRHYPSRRLLEIAAEENCPVILGYDAHSPEDLSDDGIEDEVSKLTRGLNLNILDTVTLRKI